MEVFALVAALVVGLATSLLLALVALTTYLASVHRRYAHIPTPEGASFYFGHVSEISRRSSKGQHFFDLLLEWYNSVGPVFIWWVFHYPIVVVNDSESLKVLMTRKVAKPVIKEVQYIAGQRFAVNSIFTIPTYDEWKDRRKAFDTAFTRNYLRSLVPEFNAVAMEYLVHSVKRSATEGKAIDMKQAFSLASLHTITRVAFGCDFSKDPFVLSVAGEAGVSKLVSLMLEGADAMFKNPLQQYYRPFKFRKYGDAIRKIRDIGHHCIKQRLKQLDNEEQVPLDILSQILKIVQIEKNIEMEDLLDEFLNFYFAGQETTSTLLSFTILMLLKNPEILQRVVNEIQEIVGHKEVVEADDLDNLVYMHQVFEETLRLYPIAAATVREAPENLNLCGYPIPKGSMVLVSSYVMHHRPEVFDDPEVFNPDRFAPDQKRPSPYNYFPFGVGHRSCIGRVFAIMEAKVMLAHLLRTFSLTLPEDYQVKVTQYIELIHPEGEIPCTATLKK